METDDNCTADNYIFAQCTYLSTHIKPIFIRLMKIKS